MQIAAGRLTMGRCEGLDGEGVTTHFFFIGPFFVPLDTVYTVGHWRSARAFQVKRHAKSIALAYLRWCVAPLVMCIAFIAAEPPQLSDGGKLTLALMATAWLGLVFLTGRAWGRTARQRRVLSASVGHAAPPELLFSGTLGLVMEDLDRVWSKLAAEEESWRDLFPKDVSLRTLPLYYTLCRYEAALADEQVMRNRARLAWSRIEADWAKVEPSLSRKRPKRPLGLDGS
jgi:hypothetical protein